mmetsp:Transcript_26289/g.67939  ORF Transcript_26289/g.67939 Transcript_26289/m.67939 type:complete len:214 (-) Transcript_26289:284-925(-)
MGLCAGLLQRPTGALHPGRGAAPPPKVWRREAAGGSRCRRDGRHGARRNDCPNAAAQDDDRDEQGSRGRVNRAHRADYSQGGDGHGLQGHGRDGDSARRRLGSAFLWQGPLRQVLSLAEAGRWQAEEVERGRSVHVWHLRWRIQRHQPASGRVGGKLPEAPRGAVVRGRRSCRAGRRGARQRLLRCLLPWHRDAHHPLVVPHGMDGRSRPVHL